jgi:fumarate hydratase class II
VGYDVAAEVAHEAYRTGRTVRDVCTERELLDADELDRLLDARSQTGE